MYRCWIWGSLDDMKLSREDCVSSEEKRLRNVPFPPVPVVVPRSAADSVLLVMADVVDVVEDM